MLLGQLSDATAHLVDVGTGLDEDGVGTTSANISEDTVEIASPADQHVPKLQSEARCRAQEQFQRFGVLWIWGGDDGHTPRPRHDFLDQLESLWPQLLIEERYSCGIAARARQARDEPSSDWVTDTTHDDGDTRSRS